MSKHISEETIQFVINEPDRVEQLTKLINGTLKAVIITTTQNINIKLSLEEHDVVLYNDLSFDEGTRYLPLLAQGISDKNEAFDAGITEWALNDKVLIEVIGSEDTAVTVTFRYEQ